MNSRVEVNTTFPTSREASSDLTRSKKREAATTTTATWKESEHGHNQGFLNRNMRKQFDLFAAALQIKPILSFLLTYPDALILEVLYPLASTCKILVTLCFPT